MKIVYVPLCTLFAMVLCGGGVVNAVEKPTTRQETCVTAQCHGEYAQQNFVHGPVGLGDCKSCHRVSDPNTHAYVLTREGRDLCEYCHLDQSYKTHVHKPLQEEGCTACHDPHASKGKFLLNEKTVADFCKTCHDVTSHTYLHGPTAVGQCTVCHEPHSSDFNDLLTQEPKELCTACHVVTKDELSQFEFVHEPAKGDCVGCHDPHGSESNKMLKGNAPEMCYACHEEIQKIAEGSDHKHGVVRQEGGCLQCHTPHASTVRYLLLNDPATLCLDCHDKPVGIDKDEVLGPFAAEIKGKKFLHGPVKDKSCSGCHVTHGSDHFRLLRKEYPAAFYAPYADENYALCFTCHEKTIVQTKLTNALTDFRNGDLNLHYLHVNKTRRGRTCRACHETHASNLPKHIRAEVPFGVWKLPIGYDKTETGGSCAPGCHVPLAYDRVQPVEYETQKTSKDVVKVSEKP